jgi:hypothetical protein
MMEKQPCGSVEIMVGCLGACLKKADRIEASRSNNTNASCDGLSLNWARGGVPTGMILLYRRACLNSFLKPAGIISAGSYYQIAASSDSA